MSRTAKGFTLIELLIVVAIIAILAAIAVPNFLEAQVRSKVSRVKSELRTLATAIEAYAVDNNRIPAAAGEANEPALTIDGQGGQTGILTPRITTPIAYITTFTFKDPFVGTDAIRPDFQLYSYHTYLYRWDAVGVADTTAIAGNEGAQLTGVEFKEFYGMYRVFSIGPDKDYNNNLTTTFSGNIGLIYDPTNGSVSLGNVIRSQKESEQKTHKVF